MTEQANESEQEMVLPAEAGFSLNWSMIDTAGLTVSVTMRGAHVAEWPDVMKHRAAFIERAMKASWNVPGKLPTITGAPQAQPVVTPQAAAQHPSAPTGTPVATTPTAEILVLTATKMDVSPLPEQKVKLGFYSAGHKFPDLYYQGDVANAVKLLAPGGAWTPEHLAVATSYENLALQVRYTLSKKLNSKGNPFKDIVNITA